MLPQGCISRPKCSRLAVGSTIKGRLDFNCALDPPCIQTLTHCMVLIRNRKGNTGIGLASLFGDLQGSHHWQNLSYKQTNLRSKQHYRCIHIAALRTFYLSIPDPALHPKTLFASQIKEARTKVDLTDHVLANMTLFTRVYIAHTLQS